MLELKNIHISFDRSIFRNAQIQFYSSSIHAIIGKSGSGKTTFLKSIINDTPHMQFHMIYNNEDVHEKDEFVRNHVAYVDQLGSFFPNMTIKQHFQFYAEMKNEKVDKKKINQYLERVNLKNINLNKSPSVLSIGERKRMLIALALFCDKDILILDEPTVSLDKKNISLLKQVLLSLKDKTIILTTHTPEILEICDVIYKIENQEFVCERNNINEVNENLTQSKRNYSFSPMKYFKYKSPIQWIQYIGSIVLSLFILFQTSMILNSLFDVLYVNPMAINQSSKEMLFIRNREGELVWEYVPFMDTKDSKPIDKDDLSKIKNMKGIKSIQNFEVFTLFNPNNMEEAQELEVIHKNGESKNYSVLDRGSDAPAIYPYYEENEFNNHDNGIYISYWLSQNYGIQVGDTIKGKFYVPKDQYKKSNGQEYRSVTYTLREVEFEVSQVIDEDKEYYVTLTNNIIYVPYKEMEKMISDIDENAEIISSYYIDNVLSTQVSPEPYEMNEQVLFVDEDHVQEVHNAFLEMDDEYDTYSTYLAYLDLDQMSKDSFKTNLLSFGVVCGVGVIGLLTIQFFLIRSRRKEFELLQNNGIQGKVIDKSLLFENSIYFVLMVIGGLVWVVTQVSREYIVTQILTVSGISFILLFLNQVIAYVVLKKKKV